jgi:hypothetical protein
MQDWCRHWEGRFQPQAFIPMERLEGRPQDTLDRVTSRQRVRNEMGHSYRMEQLRWFPRRVPRDPG